MVSGTIDKEHLMSYFASDSTNGYMYGEEFQVELGWPLQVSKKENTVNDRITVQGRISAAARISAPGKKQKLAISTPLKQEEALI